MNKLILNLDPNLICIFILIWYIIIVFRNNNCLINVRNEEKNFDGNKSLIGNILENNNVWLSYLFFCFKIFIYLKKQIIFAGKNLN